MSSGIYVLKVTLAGTKPPVWRRLRVPAAMHLGELHAALQVAMGWEDDHLHGFAVGDDNFGPEADPGSNTKREQKASLATVARKGSRFVYTYDFGDSWEHEIVVEDVVDDDGGPLPACVDGRRACPPEDCGGIPGYQQILNALRSPTTKANAERLEWVGEYDPDEFNAQTVNGYMLEVFGDDIRSRLRLRALKEVGRRASRPKRIAGRRR